MLPIDPGDGQGSVTPARPLGDSVPLRDSVPFKDSAPFKDSVPFKDSAPLKDRAPLKDMLPAQSMAHGGTIIRPGAVAWGGLRDSGDSGYSSCEAIERILASVAADAGQLTGLLTELTTTRLWVPLAVRHRPFTDGTAVRLPLIDAGGDGFVPCFTSVQRLTAWVDAADRPRTAASDEFQFAESGRRWQRAGDTRVVPHIVVPAAGLARRLPSGLGLALNPGDAHGLPLYPECVSYLARLPPAWQTPETGQRASTGAAVPWPTALRPSADWSQVTPRSTTPAAMTAAATTAGVAFGVGHPPVEPRALLDATRADLRALQPVRYASRAWLSVPGEGEGLIISVALDDPASEAHRSAAIDALERACAAVPLRVPFPVDVTFPGEPVSAETSPTDLIDEWIARNTRPFYTRD
jgi:SseB protein N-terminal domain